MCRIGCDILLGNDSSGDVPGRVAHIRPQLLDLLKVAQGVKVRGHVYNTLYTHTKHIALVMGLHGHTVRHADRRTNTDRHCPHQ